MPYAIKEYTWTWDLAASPEELWRLVSDTDRFNRDCGFPAVTVAPASAHESPSPADTRRLFTRHLGLTIEWDERPFEWTLNRAFGVERIFHRGPFARILALCELAPRSPAGTRLTYRLWFTPANILGVLALKAGGADWQFRRPFDRVFRLYDRLAVAGTPTTELTTPAKLSPGGAARLATLSELLIKGQAQPAALVEQLTRFVVSADNLDGQRIRAYALADRWRTSRRETLQLCLHATRVGLLDFHWDVLCPHCRGAKAVASTLQELKAEAYCDTCRIDFVAEFDRSVELTFNPNPAIRHVPRTTYCVGGPQLTPHIVIQQSLRPEEARILTLALAPGRYRLRAQGIERPWRLRIDPAGEKSAVVVLTADPNRRDEAVLVPGAELTLVSRRTTATHLAIEHLAWTDQATMASEVTSLQLFRDLFAREVLRPGGRIAINSLTIVFTDLKGSTQLYRTIGDAPAFSQVLTHFDLLKSAVETEGGAIVKTMGDAIMAVFPRPAPALRAMLTAQRQLALAQSVIPWNGPPGHARLTDPLLLKAGLHHGPCIAITQNERLDYFGTTVNVAARLCGLSTGTDLLLSDTVLRDAEIRAVLAELPVNVKTAVERTTLRGMADDIFEVCRVHRGSPSG